MNQSPMNQRHVKANVLVEKLIKRGSPMTSAQAKSLAAAILDAVESHGFDAGINSAEYKQLEKHYPRLAQSVYDQACKIDDNPEG